MLGIVLVVGDDRARSLACGMAVGLVGGFVPLVAGIRRAERSGDAPPRSLWQIVRDLPARNGRVIAFAGGLAFVVLTAGLAGGTGARGGTGWLNLTLAALASAGFASGLWWARRFVLRSEGVERDVHFRSSSLAFNVMLIAMSSYAMFEQFAGAPRIALSYPLTLGVITWLGADVWYTRKAS